MGSRAGVNGVQETVLQEIQEDKEALLTIFMGNPESLTKDITTFNFTSELTLDDQLLNENARGECSQAPRRVGAVKCTSLVGQKFAITLVCPQMIFLFLYFFSSFSINPRPPARIEPLSARPAVIELRFVSKPFCDWLF